MLIVCLCLVDTSVTTRLVISIRILAIIINLNQMLLPVLLNILNNIVANNGIKYSDYLYLPAPAYLVQGLLGT